MEDEGNNMRTAPVPRLSSLVCLASLAFLAVTSAFAGNAANPDAVELVPLPRPTEFASDMDSPVTFDEVATVTVACPDVGAAA